MSSISAVAVQSAALLSPLSRNATSSSATAATPQPAIKSVGLNDPVDGVSFGFDRIHCSAAVDTSGLAQYNGGASDDIAAASEYVQQKVIYEAALSMVVHGSLSAPEANYLLRDGY